MTNESKLKKTKTTKVNGRGSLGFRIPDAIAEICNLKEGQDFELETNIEVLAEGKFIFKKISKENN